jgi:outer membrane lipoprotein-sorting protein
MKRLMLILLLLFSPGMVWGGEDPAATEIVERMNKLQNQPSMYSEAAMTIQTSSGQERTYTYKSWMLDGGDKVLMEYTSPRRVKGQKTLLLNQADDIWVYFPRTGRVRKLATHAKRQKLQGSDFSYEDAGGGNLFVTDFTPRLLGQEKYAGKKCWLLELNRKQDSGSSYARLLLWVDRESYLPYRIDYFEKEGQEEPDKRLVQEDVRLVDGIPTAFRLVMYNLNEAGETRVELTKVRYNLEVDPELFSERGLKQ